MNPFLAAKAAIAHVPPDAIVGVDLAPGVIDIKRVRRGRLNLGIANGRVYVDDEHVYTALDMKVGLKNVLDGDTGIPGA